ncbi:DNA primase large subunit PriL [Candidatus Bathyarchaeota archaeon]|nr:DNA primase large subunit PriL [Candidatus Bathyarchaeota archaeon]
MQRTFSAFVKNDYAKYPFLKAAIKHIQKLNLKIQDLTDPDNENILKRAQQRLEEAILDNIVSLDPQHVDIEIVSFPVAVTLAIATKDSFIKKRYALAEANRAYEELLLEPKEKIIQLAENFDWKIAVANDVSLPYDFAVSFVDYLRNTTHLKETRWKLANRMLSNGVVYLRLDDVTRLLKEEVRRHIEQRLDVQDLPVLPAKLIEIAEKMKKLVEETIGKPEREGFPTTITQTAFPPCIQSLYQAFTTGKHLSHIGRFTLTAFLANIGMPTESIIDLFKSFSDYSERMTRYQVEHIAGEKGSRTRYVPPKCETLKTHGICINPDELCQRIYHPLTYYRRKIQKIASQSHNGEE